MRLALRALAAGAFVVLGLGACDGRPSRGDGGTGGAGDPPAAGVVPTSTTDAPPSRCDPARARAGSFAGALTFGGLERRYAVHVPTGYDGSVAVPLVFSFHGHGSNAGIQLAYSAIAPVADREGFLVVAPEGQGSPPHFTLLGATPTEADDVDFTLALLDELTTTLCIDERRVYTMGMSNGGALSAVLACRAGDRFAAAGAVAAVIHLPQPCADAERVAPLAAMMGTADPVVPYAGGRVNCCGNPEIPATEDTMASFARAAGCARSPTTSRPVPTVEHRTWTGCRAGAAVELYVIEGGGHTWPGSPFDASGRGLGAGTSDLPATESLWAFFERHQLPAT